MTSEKLVQSTDGASKDSEWIIFGASKPDDNLQLEMISPENKGSSFEYTMLIRNLTREGAQIVLNYGYDKTKTQFVLWLNQQGIEWSGHL